MFLSLFALFSVLWGFHPADSGGQLPPTTIVVQPADSGGQLPPAGVQPQDSGGQLPPVK